MEPKSSLPCPRQPAVCPFLTQIIPIHALPSHCIRSSVTLFSHIRLGLPNILFLPCIPSNTLYVFLFSAHTCHMSLLFDPAWCDHLRIFSGKHRSWSSSLYRVIRNDCRGFNNLPPLSPDATPCDFFLWGYVKDQVYVPPLPASILETEGTNQNRHWNHHRGHATNSLERTRLSCWCL